MKLCPHYDVSEAKNQSKPITRPKTKQPNKKTNNKSNKNQQRNPQQNPYIPISLYSYIPFACTSVIYNINDMHFENICSEESKRD